MAKQSLTLHEAMVLCMVRKKRFRMSSSELARLIAHWELWRRPEDDEFPEARQVFLRANQKAYRWLFEVEGDSHASTVSLSRRGRV